MISNQSTAAAATSSKTSSISASTSTRAARKSSATANQNELAGLAYEEDTVYDEDVNVKTEPDAVASIAIAHDHDEDTVYDDKTVSVYPDEVKSAISNVPAAAAASDRKMSKARASLHTAPAIKVMSTDTGNDVSHKASEQKRKSQQSKDEGGAKKLGKISCDRVGPPSQQQQEDGRDLTESLTSETRTLEELWNSFSPKSYDDCLHHSFRYASWIDVHKWISSQARALFGNSLDRWNCVDIGAGILTAVISGATANPKMHWMGIEIDPKLLRRGAEIYSQFNRTWKQLSQGQHSLNVGFLKGDCTQPLNLQGTNICLLWDRALAQEVVEATFDSLARSYTQPFLLIMSNYWWKRRTVPLIERVFEHVQVVGTTPSYKISGFNSGDRLIMSIVKAPLKSALDQLPPLDESCPIPIVMDIFSRQFGSEDKRCKEVDRFLKEETRTRRTRNKPTYFSSQR